MEGREESFIEYIEIINKSSIARPSNFTQNEIQNSTKVIEPIIDDIISTFTGRWRQTEAENVDAVNTELGFPWYLKGMSNLFDVTMKIGFDQKGIHIDIVILVKTIKSFLPFKGVDKSTTGFGGEVRK